MFGWSTRDRLTPMRMVWMSRHMGNTPKYDLAKWRKPDLKPFPRHLNAVTKVEDDRLRRLHYPRVLDEYGIGRRPKRS